MEKDESTVTTNLQSPTDTVTLNTEKQKDDHAQKSASISSTSEALISPIKVKDDKNKKVDFLITEKENNDLLSPFESDAWKSALSSPFCEVNASHFLIEDYNNKKTVFFENDQKKDGVVADNVMKKDDENKKSDLILTEKKKNEDLLENDQKKNELVHVSNIDIPIEDLKAPSGKIETYKVGIEEGSNSVDILKVDLKAPSEKNETSQVGKEEANKLVKNVKFDELECKTSDSKKSGSETEEKRNENLDEVEREGERESIFDGTEVPDMESDSQASLSDKALAVKNLLREKSLGAVSTVIRRLSGNSDDEVKPEKSEAVNKELLDAPKKSQTEEKAGWNPLSLIGSKADVEAIEGSLIPLPMRGRILLYTKLGCKDCNEARIFLRRKRLRYVEINIDVYPSRKIELEKIACSTSVPRVFFNEILIGGVSEMRSLDESGKLKEKIEYVVTETPPFEAPLPPLSGEDDMSTFGTMDELAVIVRKMKESIVVKDRFYKMRRFTNCFVGSEAVDFLSEDQYLERADAVEFGRKLANGLFFQHVLEENLFEDGNHLYRFLDQDPIVMSQCYNMPRGITEIKPKPVTDISSRLRFLSYAIFEAYSSEDGRHVDYRSIHGSEEFARYLRIIEELQRVDLNNTPREEKLAFFMNLFNMMVIHAILMMGYPTGALDRRKMLGDFKYIIGGCTYSLSDIQNGVLRANQRPPYTLTKPFGLKDKRAKVALAYPEPLIHFALVYGNRSSPPLRCYSPGDVDKELMDAARDFLRSGGLTVDLNTKVTSATKILKWYSIDFGKNEVEVLKHAANFLEPDESEAMLELLATTQLKVIYQPYDWSLNN